jgi:hypothetical protein
LSDPFTHSNQAETVGLCNRRGRKSDAVIPNAQLAVARIGCEADRNIARTGVCSCSAFCPLRVGAFRLSPWLCPTAACTTGDVASRDSSPALTLQGLFSDRKGEPDLLTMVKRLMCVFKARAPLDHLAKYIVKITDTSTPLAAQAYGRRTHGSAMDGSLSY